MNLKPFLIFLILVCCSGLVSAQYNYTQKLGNLATIKLPDSPKITHVEGGELYIVQKGPIYIAQVGDVKGGLRDLFKKSNTDSYYNGYINGALKSNKGAKLFYKNKLKINGHEGIEFGYKAILNDQQTYRYQHVVFVNDTLLMCGIWSSDSLSKDDPNLKPFFNGFKIKTAEQLSTAQASELGHKTGKVIGMLMALSIPVLLGLGIVFIIRKLVYKKANHELKK
jgi:hypothetical protein